MAPVGVGQAPVVAATEQAPAIQQASDITLDLLQRVMQGTPFRVRQVRRFLQPDDTMVGVIEDLTCNGDPTQPRFDIDFISVEGTAPSPQATGQWSATYATNGSLLHEHGGFRVRDLRAARIHYSMNHFGRSMRGGQPVWWVVIAPNSRDKASWVLALDEQSALPVYQAQIDPRGRLLGEIDVRQLSLTTSPQASWWTPVLAVSRFSTAEAARVAMTAPQARGVGSGLLVPAIDQVMPEYSLYLAQVTADPANGQQTMVLGYTDGIDEFFVLQSPGVADPFAGLPVGTARPTTKASGPIRSDREMAIARYEDSSLRVYLFQRNSVMVRIAGNGSLVRLNDVALRIAQQAVTGV
ncbi:MAG: hypothetical protein IPK26_19255 [Planctomycetes bacterium]|nr:hypothetical protein [Planctomycetota bacterium]